MYNCEGFPLIFKYVIFVAILFLAFRRLNKKADYIIFFLILAAGVLNVWEKISTGCVYDPFDFFGFFSFNWRDAVVTAGTAVLVFRTIYDKTKA